MSELTLPHDTPTLPPLPRPDGSPAEALPPADGLSIPGYEIIIIQDMKDEEDRLLTAREAEAARLYKGAQ
jgi:hypothetical protein